MDRISDAWQIEVKGQSLTRKPGGTLEDFTALGRMVRRPTRTSFSSTICPRAGSNPTRSIR